MTTSFQLPVVRDIELFQGNPVTIQLELGLNLSAFGSYGIVAYVGSSALSVSVVSATTGVVTVSIPSSLSVEDGALWQLRFSAPSSADPEYQLRTLAWGRVKVVTPKTISPASSIYHAVQMVSGDEFTFDVNLNANITGKFLSAGLYSFSDEIGEVGLGFPSTLHLSVLSPTTGLVQVTIGEDTSFACRGSGASWWLRDFSSSTVLRAGPVTAYVLGSSSAAAAAEPNLGSVFL